MAPRREPRFVPWVAHHEPALLIISGVIQLVVFGDDLISSLLLYLGAAVFAVAITASLRHSYSYLCTRCAEATPLDGNGEAQRRTRSLQAFHTLREGRRRQYIVFATVVVLMIAPVVLKLILGYSSVWGRILVALVWLYWVVSSFLYLRHLPVQPWCPQCHWDDGGDDEESPIIPEPVAPSGDR